MVKLVKGKPNIIGVNVSSTISLEGFSAALSMLGFEKTLDNIEGKNLQFEFSEGEVAEVGDEGVYGVLTIYNASEEPYIKLLPQFVVVDTERAARGYQSINIVISTTYPTMRGGGADGEAIFQRCKAYVDGEIEELGQNIIQNEEVIVTIDGQTVKMTMQEAVTKVIEVENQVDQMGQTVIKNEIIEVPQGEGEEPIRLTVQQAVEQLVELEKKAEEHVTATYLDEDHDGYPDNEALILSPNV